MIEQIKSHIEIIEDFPIKGISFKDISPLLKSKYFKESIKLMGDMVNKPEYWVGIESRGFIFASALSLEFGGGVLLCRKKGKLPPPVISHEYTLEYGTDKLEVKPGSGSVVIVDDVLATGGTMKAGELLLTKAGYTIVDKLVLINLKYLNNIDDVKGLINYE
jgi:adenine phosphoribosyltransferase